MNSRNQKIFVGIASILAVIGVIYTVNNDTLFSQLVIDPLGPVKWDEVHPREIIKVVLLMNIIEESGNDCKVKVDRLDTIIDHEPFIRSQEFAQKVNFDRDTNTIIVPCDDLAGEKSRLHIWYVDEASSMHATKYQYVITPFEVTEFNMGN